MPPFDTVTFTAQQHAWDYLSYDKMVARFCNALKVCDANGVPTARPIPLIFATPERAWAQMRKKFEKQLATESNFRIPLPFLSVMQIGDATFDERRYLYKKIQYRKVALDTETYTACLSHSHPLPYTFQYSIELWVKSRYEGRVAVAQFASLWDEGKMAYRKVDHGYPMGVKWIPTFLEGITDNTNLEVSDQQRTLRWSFTIRVEGWLPPVPVEQKLVHEVDVEVHELDNPRCDDADIYGDTELDAYYPLSHGNPETGEIVDDHDDFAVDYDGTDYRLARFSPGNPCVSV